MHPKNEKRLIYDDKSLGELKSISPNHEIDPDHEMYSYIYMEKEKKTIVNSEVKKQQNASETDGHFYAYFQFVQSQKTGPFTEAVIRNHVNLPCLKVDNPQMGP